MGCVSTRQRARCARQGWASRHRQARLVAADRRGVEQGTGQYRDTPGRSSSLFTYMCFGPTLSFGCAVEAHSSGRRLSGHSTAGSYRPRNHTSSRCGPPSALPRRGLPAPAALRCKWAGPDGHDCPPQKGSRADTSPRTSWASPCDTGWICLQPWSRSSSNTSASAPRCPRPRSCAAWRIAL